MVRTRVKICGLSVPEDAAVAAAAGADAIGLVFVEASPRCVTFEQGSKVVEAVPPLVDIVGLFIEIPASALWSDSCDLPLSMIQLHGNQQQRDIAMATPVRVLRALPFDAATIEQQLRHWDEVYKELGNFSGLVVDTPDDQRIGGGTGKVYDWTALRKALDNVQPSVPIIMAGGLTPENVGEAIRIVHPYGVDVSSGVARERGVKDPDKIRAFCDAAHEADERS